MRKVYNSKESTRKERKFSSRDMSYNTAISAIGAGVAAAGATGAILPIIATAVAGGIVGYTVMNEIPANRKEGSE